MARGLVTADGFGAVRALLVRSRSRGPPGARTGRGCGRGGALGGVAVGRPMVTAARPVLPPTIADELAEAVAEQLLARWGVVFRDLVVRETLAVPWREIQWALRRLEARGTVRGGRFVTGFSGEQYALPEAVEALRAIRKLERTGETVTLAGADPLNLVGIVVPGPRVPAVRTNEVTYVDGVPIEAEPALA